MSYRCVGITASVLAVMAFISTGCDRREPAAQAHSTSALEPDRGAGEAAYLTPPSVQLASASADGAVAVSGRAPPHSEIQLVSPDGTRTDLHADAKGAWRASLPPAAMPRLFAISAMADGRTLHAEGALLLAPGGLSPAVLLRAGAAALPLTPSNGGLDITSADYDPAGSLAVAGQAPANAAVALMVDGGAAAAGHADGQGRYALLAAGRRLALGAHRLAVSAGGRSATRQVLMTPPGPLNAPFAAERVAEGWRVEWAPTGGGVQTTLVLAP